MKKILLAILGFTFIYSVNSQSFTLSYDGVNLDPGATLTIAADPSVELISAIIFITNNSSVAKSVKVKKVVHEGDTLAGTLNSFCWGLCYGDTTYVSPFPQTIQAGATSDLFYGDYRPNNIIGISKVMYVFWDVDNRNDSVAINVDYKASPASIGDDLKTNVVVSDVYPNPAVSNAYVDYTMTASFEKASIIITNMVGARVKEIQLTDRSGKARIDVSDMQSGFYFYTFMADSKQVMTGKFIVKH